MIRVIGSRLYFLSQGNVGHTGGSRAGKMFLNDQFARDSLSRYAVRRTPVTRTLKGHEKQFEVVGVRVIGVD